MPLICDWQPPDSPHKAVSFAPHPRAPQRTGDAYLPASTKSYRKPDRSPDLGLPQRGRANSTWQHHSTDDLHRPVRPSCRCNSATECTNPIVSRSSTVLAARPKWCDRRFSVGSQTLLSVSETCTCKRCTHKNCICNFGRAQVLRSFVRLSERHPGVAAKLSQPPLMPWQRRPWRGRIRAECSGKCVHESRRLPPRTRGVCARRTISLPFFTLRSRIVPPTPGDCGFCRAEVHYLDVQTQARYARPQTGDAGGLTLLLPTGLFRSQCVAGGPPRWSS